MLEKSVNDYGSEMGNQHATAELNSVEPSETIRATPHRVMARVMI